MGSRLQSSWLMWTRSGMLAPGSLNGHGEARALPFSELLCSSLPALWPGASTALAPGAAPGPGAQEKPGAKHYGAQRPKSPER